MFAPATRHPDLSFNRTSEAQRIVERNLTGPAPGPSSMFADVSAIRLLSSMLRNQPQGAAGGREAVLDLFRSIGIVRMMGEDDDDDDDESGALVGPQHDSDGDGDE